ncbi:MAG: 30S ribosomal protein S5 [Candidatus Harrisonbacteria bacterium]|nr:30S ribosomal protein S5 [Candidatus Harrisonbacteria bacterium]
MEENKIPTEPTIVAKAEEKAAETTKDAPQGKRKKIHSRRQRRKTPFKRKEEFAEQVVDLRRVTRVMAGGKRFRFRATLIIGDRKGRVGVGIGKGGDVVQSIDKAKRDAKKHLIVVPMRKRTIPHEVDAKYSAARVLLKPAQEGNGLVAGGAVRIVLSLAGVADITAKCLGKTSNKLTNAMATIEALKQLKPLKQSKKKEESKEEGEKKEIVNAKA